MFPKAWQILDEAPRRLRGSRPAHRGGRLGDPAAHRRRERATPAPPATKRSGASEEGYPASGVLRARWIRAWPTSSTRSCRRDDPARSAPGPAASRRRWPSGWGCGPARRWRWPTSTRTWRSRRRPWSSPGQMVMVMGTSICHLVLGDGAARWSQGMCGVVEDGILPGFYGYEAGQSAVGDIFAWFVGSRRAGATYATRPDSAGSDLHAAPGGEGQQARARAKRPARARLVEREPLGAGRCRSDGHDLRG